MKQFRDLNISTLRHNLQRALESKEMKVPQNYLVMDLETTGVDSGTDVIWQIGLYPVLGGQPQSEHGDALYLAHPPEKLKTATFEISRRCAVAQGISTDKKDLDTRVRDGHYYQAEQQFVDEVTTKGKDPKLVIEQVLGVIQAFVDAGAVIIGQNSCKFDIPFLTRSALFYGIDFKFPRTRLIDTGMLLKAAQLSRNQMAHETCTDFYVRIAAERAKGVYYSLDKCAKHWDFDKRFGINMAAQGHDAAFDCYITSLVMRELINEVWKSEGVTV